jgi:hypothetical protein
VNLAVNANPTSAGLAVRARALTAPWDAIFSVNARMQVRWRVVGRSRDGQGGRACAHWNYPLVIETDVNRLSRYVEFCGDNFKTYSVELARLLMTSAAEV